MEFYTTFQPYRKKPYVARWYEHGRPRNRFFSTEQARDTFVRTARLTSIRMDVQLPAVPIHELGRWQQARKLAPEADPVEVFQFWVKAQRERQQAEQRNLQEATAGYVQSMQQVGRNPSYIGHVQRALADLHEEIGNPPVRDITPTLLRNHLFGLPYGAVTKRNRRTYLLAAFGWWEKQGWLESNPMRKVENPEVLDKEPGILTVPETIQLFRANESVDPEICGLLALGAFAGMRSSAIARLEFGELDFTQQGILTPAEKTKKRRRQWIEGLPENLWAWLQKTPPSAFEMSHRHLLHRRAQAFKRAGLLLEADDLARENAKRERKGEPLLELQPRCPPKNCLRHSFVTYHVALHRNPGKTSLLVSHRDQDCLYRHYLGIATQTEAEKYFQILPRK